MADELAERLLARHRLGLFGVRKLVLGQRAERRPQHFPIEPVLAGKMVIDGGLVDPRLGDDGAHAGGVIAALGEQPLRSFKDAVAGDFGRSRHYWPFSNPRLNSKYAFGDKNANFAATGFRRRAWALRWRPAVPRTGRAHCRG